MNELYVGINGKARKIKNIYVGVNNIARTVKNVYTGVDGVAKQSYAGNKEYIYNRGKFGRFTSGFHLGGWQKSGAIKTSTCQYFTDYIAFNFNKYACLITNDRIDLSSYKKLYLEYNYKTGWSRYRIYITPESAANAEYNYYHKFLGNPEISTNNPQIYVSEIDISTVNQNAYVWLKPAGIGDESDSDNTMSGPCLYRIWLVK